MEIAIATQDFGEFKFNGSLLASQRVSLWRLNRMGSVDFFKIDVEPNPMLQPGGKYLLAVESLPETFEIRKFYDSESVRRYFEDIEEDPDHVLRFAGQRVFAEAAGADKDLAREYARYRIRHGRKDAVHNVPKAWEEPMGFNRQRTA